jgi:hypothetical protein
MNELTPIERDQLQKCFDGLDIKSSDRPTDKARQRLKRLGYLVFEKSYWRWRITDAGRAALAVTLHKGKSP